MFYSKQIFLFGGHFSLMIQGLRFLPHRGSLSHHFQSLTSRMLVCVWPQQRKNVNESTGGALRAVPEVTCVSSAHFPLVRTQSLGHTEPPGRCSLAVWPRGRRKVWGRWNRFCHRCKLERMTPHPSCYCDQMGYSEYLTASGLMFTYDQLAQKVLGKLPFLLQLLRDSVHNQSKAKPHVDAHFVLASGWSF